MSFDRDRTAPSSSSWGSDAAVLTVAQMGEADRLAIAGGTPAIQLMENAGDAVVGEIARRWSPRPTVVLCGPGNNGGDGFVAARRLAEAGWPVRIALLGRRDHLVGEAKYHAALWLGAFEPMAPAALGDVQLVVDAVFGAGLSRALEGAALATLAAAAERKLMLVAIDVPSGVMGDTGEAFGAAAAVLTVTCFRKKPAHLILPGRALCGEVVVADIGTPATVLEQIAPNTFQNAPVLWLGELPRAQDDGSKYARGHALISGGYPMTGAARMAARAAGRVGAGLTTIAVPENALAVYAAAVTSIMVHPIAKPADFDRLLDDARLSAFLIGPGAGVNAETHARALAFLATGRPTVLDADAITGFPR